MRFIVVLTALATLVGCAAQPTQPAVPATSASAAKAAAVDPAKPAERGVPPGYKVENQGGTDFYCRSVTPIGSRFPEKMCFTREQLDEIEARTGSALGDMERGMKVCVGGKGCAPE